MQSMNIYKYIRYIRNEILIINYFLISKITLNIVKEIKVTKQAKPSS